MQGFLFYVFLYRIFTHPELGLRSFHVATFYTSKSLCYLGVVTLGRI